MTASTNSVFDLNRTGILRNAFQLIGIVPAGFDPTSDQLQLGSDFLNIVVKDLQNDGIQLRRLTRTTTTLVAGQAQYTTASDTLDIDDRTPYVSNNSGIDIPVRVISRGEYMALTNKTTGASQPSMMYIERASTVSFFLYPVPDSQWTSITYPRVVLAPDMDSAAVTNGLAAKWLKTIVYSVAVMLCDHHGLNARKASLQADLQVIQSRAENDDSEKGPVRFVPDYGIKFRRRFR